MANGIVLPTLLHYIPHHYKSVYKPWTSMNYIYISTINFMALGITHIHSLLWMLKLTISAAYPFLLRVAKVAKAFGLHWASWVVPLPPWGGDGTHGTHRLSKEINKGPFICAKKTRFMIIYHNISIVHGWILPYIYIHIYKYMFSGRCIYRIHGHCKATLGMNIRVQSIL